MGRKGEPAVDAQVIVRYAEAFAVYTEGDFKAAEKLFQRNPDDPPSRAMAKRCAEFLRTPPPAPWTWR